MLILITLCEPTYAVSPQCSLKRCFGVKAYEGVQQAAVCLVRRRFDIEHDDAEVLGSSCVRTVSLLTAPKVPPPPPLSAQNRSGLTHAFAIWIEPSAVTTSASNRLDAAVP